MRPMRVYQAVACISVLDNRGNIQDNTNNKNITDTVNRIMKGNNTK